MVKYKQISQLLEKRIRYGDYVSEELPTEMNLASEIGVSRTTARKAIMHLIDRGVLMRGENGRVLCSEEHVQQTTRVAFLTPAWPSSEMHTWRYSLEQAAAKLEIQLRPIDYVHPDDPVIIQAAESFDGIFLLPGPEAFPQPVIDRLKRCPRIIVVGQDYSWANLLSIHCFPPEHIRQLLDIFSAKHLSRVDFLAAQPIGPTMEGRIGQWWAFKRDTGMTGELITSQLKPYTMTAHNGYELMRKYLKQTPCPIKPENGPHGLLCGSINASIGASRAVTDAGLKIGKDVLIAAINGEEINRYLQPSITCLESRDTSAYLQKCLNWIKLKTQAWDGPILMEPAAPSLFIGESTGH